MQSQNVNLIKPNKSSNPPQLNIPQLHPLQPMNPPRFHQQAAQPLNLTYEQVRAIYSKPSPNAAILQSSTNPTPPPKTIPPAQIQQLQILRKENHSLKQNLRKMQQLYQEQKFKYNELKNLYKQGQAMFELLEDKKIALQKQNKELKKLLENCYHELHQENQQFQDEDFRKNKKQNFMPTITHIQQQGSSKIQKVKIGNKKIPVIKVNVPLQTFTKKEHTSSVFSQNQEPTSQEKNNRQQISILKEEIKLLKGTNNQLEKKLSEIIQELEAKKKLVLEFERRECNVKTISTSERCNMQVFERKESSSIGTQSQHQKNSFNAFDFKYPQLQNQFSVQTFNQSQQYHDRQNLSYYKSKYNILETQVKKKDEALKNLYNQCYSLQAQISRLKTQTSSFQQTQAGSHRDPRQVWTQQKPFSHFQMLNLSRQQIEQNPNNESFQQGEGPYQNKITQLQSRVNELNQLCISNVNQTFRINELNDTITKLTRENSQYQQKIMSQQGELSRLYKILENKNTQLSEIYTTISESKRNSAVDESKKKSMNNILVNTPQKNNEFMSQNIFYSKGYSKDQSFH